MNKVKCFLDICYILEFCATGYQILAVSKQDWRYLWRSESSMQLSANEYLRVSVHWQCEGKRGGKILLKKERLTYISAIFFWKETVAKRLNSISCDKILGFLEENELLRMPYL